MAKNSKAKIGEDKKKQANISGAKKKQAKNMESENSEPKFMESENSEAKFMESENSEANFMESENSEANKIPMKISRSRRTLRAFKRPAARMQPDQELSAAEDAAPKKARRNPNKGMADRGMEMPGEHGVPADEVAAPSKPPKGTKKKAPREATAPEMDEKPAKPGKKSFARRFPPQGGFALQKWQAMREAFLVVVGPVLEQAPSHEAVGSEVIYKQQYSVCIHICQFLLLTVTIKFYIRCVVGISHASVTDMYKYVYIYSSNLESMRASLSTCPV